MDLIADIPLIGGFLATVLPFVVVLAIVVFVHEYGHYIVARWLGIRSEVFSIGFGPVLWSRPDRRGTVWQIAAVPLGGYVKFLGDSDGSSRADGPALDAMSATDRAESSHGAAVWKRMLTVLAGPVFNFLLTVAVFTGVVMWQGVPTERPTIGTIGTLPGVEQPLLPGDVILQVFDSRNTDAGRWHDFVQRDRWADGGPDFHDFYFIVEQCLNDMVFVGLQFSTIHFHFLVGIVEEQRHDGVLVG